jgi:hypothetical protein
MRRMAFLIWIAVLAPNVAKSDVVRHSSIPQAYWGRWAVTPETCGDADKPAIVLSGKTYVSPTANCTVDYVSETAGPKGSFYSARLSCSDGAGGAPKKSGLNVIIRPGDGDSISVGPGFDSLVAYRRCPANGTDTKQ